MIKQTKREIEFLAKLRALLGEYGAVMEAIDDGDLHGMHSALIDVSFREPYGRYEMKRIYPDGDPANDVASKKQYDMSLELQTPEEMLARWSRTECQCDTSVGHLCELCHDSIVVRKLIKERDQVDTTVIPTEEWNGLYWSYNCPLQMWGNPKDGWRVLNYMPRKEHCCTLDDPVTLGEMPQFCRNAAARLRNLALLFEAMADGKIETIYYPDETVEEAVAARVKNDLLSTES